jgi:hypothetical protein
MPFKKGQQGNPGFAKGQSGNPGGRPKIAEEINALARQHCPEAIEALVHIMRNGKPDAARALAADKILDRGCGRAPQAHTGTDGGAVNLTLRHIYEGKPPGEK